MSVVRAGYLTVFSHVAERDPKRFVQGLNNAAKNGWDTFGEPYLLKPGYLVEPMLVQILVRYVGGN